MPATALLFPAPVAIVAALFLAACGKPVADQRKPPQHKHQSQAGTEQAYKAAGDQRPLDETVLQILHNIHIIKCGDGRLYAAPRPRT